MPKFVLTFKDSDYITDQLMDAANELDTDYETLYEFVEQWIDSGEFVSVEFDMDSGTANVVEA